MSFSHFNFFHVSQPRFYLPLGITDSNSGISSPISIFASNRFGVCAVFVDLSSGETNTRLRVANLANRTSGRQSGVRECFCFLPTERALLCRLLANANTKPQSINSSRAELTVSLFCTPLLLVCYLLMSSGWQPQMCVIVWCAVAACTEHDSKYMIVVRFSFIDNLYAERGALILLQHNN